MSSRAVRRLTQQTERHTVDTQQHDKLGEPEGGTSIESRSPTPIKGNVFSSFACNLFSNDVHCDTNDQSPESSCSNDSAFQTVQPLRSKKKKKRGKKHTCKGQEKARSANDDDLVFEMATTDTCDKDYSKASECLSLSSLLSTNSRDLDHKAELNRLFVDPAITARGGRNSTTRSVAKRGILVPFKVTWPPVVRLGLDMVKTTQGDITIFHFSHSKEYQNKQALFYAAVASMNPDNIAALLADCPYHIDSLLQLSEILVQQDNTELGIDLLERALHAYQSAFHPAFNPTLGTFHLDYRYQTNRGLFVALFRYINVVGNRSCYRTALEYSKLLLSLNSDDDPLAVLLMLDYYAICAHQFQFLIELHKSYRETKNLNLLPNFAFSLPLARFLQHQQQASLSSNSVATKQKSKTRKQLIHIEDKGMSTADAELQDALIMFPGFLPRLLKHVSIGGGTGNLDKSVLFGREVAREPANLGVLLDLYATRTRLLWSSPKVKPWLERNVESVLGLVEPIRPPTLEVSRGDAVDPRLASYSNKRNVFNRPLPRNITRHLLLLDLPEIRPHIPNETLPWQTFSFDPLPPNDSINLYTPDLRSLSINEHHGVNDAGGLLSAFLHSLLPDYAIGRVGAPQQFENEADPAPPRQAVIERLVASLRRLLDTPQDLAPDGNDAQNSD